MRATRWWLDLDLLGSELYVTQRMAPATVTALQRTVTLTVPYLHPRRYSTHLEYAFFAKKHLSSTSVHRRPGIDITSIVMPHQMHQLPPSTQSKIRSTQILTSLPQIISELVQNSLDAGASHINVGIDCEDWACWVRDDGRGIARDDFDALAGGGQAARYSETPMRPCTPRKCAHQK